MPFGFSFAALPAACLAGSCSQATLAQIANAEKTMAVLHLDPEQIVAGPGEVRRALAEVPEHNREIFLLHYVEGFSYEEIERITGVRQSALKMRVKRASDHLRARLAGVYRG